MIFSLNTRINTFLLTSTYKDIYIKYVLIALIHKRDLFNFIE